VNIVLIVNTNNRTTIVDMNNNINKPHIRDKTRTQGSSGLFNTTIKPVFKIYSRFMMGYVGGARLVGPVALRRCTPHG
jgi:hypothetical protein